MKIKAKQEKVLRTLLDPKDFVGMSGDTELFQKPSNIKGLRASEQEIILYIPPILGRLF